ncbi:MAG TPA: exopolyphosphatase [Roseiarcus sp.]|nr:exopolyphosphatase [Roseiarcus sp.]
MPFHHAQGRLPGEAVAVIDIGSNSVRLVAYESHCRAPTPTFNEKALCGLGRGVATTSLLPDEGVAKAIAALKRFRALCDTMRIADIRAIATAAVRDASNGPAFLGLAEQAIGQNIELLSGEQEARLSALGVVSSIHNADGVVGDLGGGSLELAEIKCGDTGKAVTLQIGGLSLVDLSEKSPKRAAKIVRETLSKVKLLQALSGRTFYAVGGTWRALARLHMRQRQYPMNVMHNYVIPTRDALEFARLVERIEADALLSIEAVSSARRPLLAYGAAVLEEIIRQAPPKEIVMSALGVREGLLYARLPPDARREDPLIVSAREFNQLRSRAPGHAEELFAWTSRIMDSTELGEDEDDRRLRHAACLLSDISWRAHPDYRGSQAYDLVVNAAFIGVDHPSRAFLALAASYRHLSNEDFVSPQSRSLVNARQLVRARILGAAMRVAYNVSAAMPGVLPRAPMVWERGKVVLTLPPDLAPLGGDRVMARMRQFARLIGGEPQIRII